MRSYGSLININLSGNNGWEAVSKAWHAFA